MKVSIEVKFEDMRKFMRLATFESDATDACALLSGMAAMYYGDQGRVSIDDAPAWSGILELGSAILPFEKFLLTIPERKASP